MNGLRIMRAQQRQLYPEAFLAEVDRIGSTAREYRSRIHLAGIPLLHFRFGMLEAGDAPVVGWVAGGDRCYGLLFAWGGIAVVSAAIWSSSGPS